MVKTSAGPGPDEGAARSRGTVAAGGTADDLDDRTLLELDEVPVHGQGR